MLTRVQLARDRFMKLDHMLGWAVNAIVVVAFPARMGSLAAPLWAFLAYAVAAGIALTFVENARYVREVFARADIRHYLQVRIAIVVLVGIVPFLAGGAFS